VSKKMIVSAAFCSLLSVALFAAAGQDRGAGQRGERGAAPRPDNPQSLAHIATAKKIAGNDAFLQNPFNFYCVTGNARAQNNNAPDLDPVKLFDNVYAAGNSETTVYALTSSEGIVLLDAGFENKAELLVSQLQKLGFSPDKVKYILLAHGHGDHFGGAKYFQDHFRTKVGTTAADWDLINQTPNRGGAPAAKPAKDIVLTEGQPFKFGDLTITVVAIPGHTPGSLAFIFPVKDKGKTRTAGLFGGTILTTGIITTDGLKQYTQSIAHYLDIAKKMKVEVELQNHPIFDGTPERLAKLKTAKAGDPSPFIVGTDRYLKMWNIISECIQAEIARREASSSN
jgi:metallo-beta-lactamase class B